MPLSNQNQDAFKTIFSRVITRRTHVILDNILRSDLFEAEYQKVVDLAVDGAISNIEQHIGYSGLDYQTLKRVFAPLPTSSSKTQSSTIQINARGMNMHTNVYAFADIGYTYTTEQGIPEHVSQKLQALACLDRLADYITHRAASLKDILTVVPSISELGGKWPNDPTPARRNAFVRKLSKGAYWSDPANLEGTVATTSVMLEKLNEMFLGAILSGEVATQRTEKAAVSTSFRDMEGNHKTIFVPTAGVRGLPHGRHGSVWANTDMIPPIREADDFRAAMQFIPDYEVRRA